MSRRSGLCVMNGRSSSADLRVILFVERVAGAVGYWASGYVPAGATLGGTALILVARLFLIAPRPETTTSSRSFA